MSTGIRPNIGDVGSFNIATPYNTIINPIKEYKVESIRSIQEMVDGNENPLQVLYLDVGLLETDMLQDIKNGVMVVVLTDSANNYAYVPETKFLSSPDVSGIRYQEKTLGVQLGLIPLSQNLDTVIDDINALLKGRLGINVKTTELNTSAILRLEKSKHNTIQTSRQALITTSPGYYYKYLECLESKKTLENKNNRLNCFIEKTLESGISEAASLNISALNTDLDVTTFKYRLNTNILFDTSIGVEIRTNEYVVYDSNVSDKSLKIIRLDENAVTVLKTIPVSYASNRHRIFKLNNKVVSIHTDDKLYYNVYDDELNLLDSGEVTGLISNPNLILPIQIRTNLICVGNVTSNNGNVVYISLDQNEDLIVETIAIPNTNTANTPLENNTLFDLPMFGDTGLLMYGDYYVKLTMNETTKEIALDGVFTSLYIDDKLTYFMTVQPKLYTICRVLNNKLNIVNIDGNHSTVGAYKDTGNTFISTAMITTIDRSLILLENDSTTSIKVKKIV